MLEVVAQSKYSTSLELMASMWQILIVIHIFQQFHNSLGDELFLVALEQPSGSDMKQPG